MMSSFVILIDSKNFDKRIPFLQGVFGHQVRDASSRKSVKRIFSKGSVEFDPRSKDKRKIRLTVTCSFPASSEAIYDKVSKIRRVFPEMTLESKFLAEFKRCVKYVPYSSSDHNQTTLRPLSVRPQQFYSVCARGFLSISRDRAVGHDVEFFLTKSAPEDEVVIAEDSLDPNRQQIVFVRSWSDVGAFVKKCWNLGW